MNLIAIWFGKLIYLFLRLVGRPGGTLPGFVAEKISPNILTTKLSSLPGGVIVITGTNGKTTSTKMLTSLLSEKYRVLTNPTGSNFTRGVVAAVVTKSNIFGKLKYDYAVVELDEAYAAKFVEKVKPDYSLILNVMRDQMDRFGEIDYTAKLLQTVAENTRKIVFLNADDRRVYNIRHKLTCQVKTFGVSKKLASIFLSDDDLHSKKVIFRSHPVDAELLAAEAGQTTIRIDNQKMSFGLNFFGMYNSQNSTAVALIAKELGLSNELIGRALSKIEPAFGRGEIIKYGHKKIVLQLVKNPAGFRQALLGGSQAVVDNTIIAINDNYADGRDVSWLWDVDFSKNITSQTVTTSGSRAHDMALRLAYDNIWVDKTEPNLKKMIGEIKPSARGTVIIYATYTAMLKIRSLLSAITKVERI